MRVLIASDSFKGSISSREFANILAEIFVNNRNDIIVDKIAVSDGGEGFLESFPSEFMEYIPLLVENALGETIEAKLGVYKGRIAVVEMAQASGIAQLSIEQCEPGRASSFGTGQLLAKALEMGFSKIYFGVGGTATNDGGVGIFQALGGKLYGAKREELGKGIGVLEDLHSVCVEEVQEKLRDVEITIFSDVKNPLCGENGATYIYGKQKGVKVEDMPTYDKWLKKWGEILEEKSCRPLVWQEGSGAGGGASLPLLAFAKAHICRGAEKLISELGIETKIARADLVITGEGRLDAQSKEGKLPFCIAEISSKYATPCIAVVGSVEERFPKCISDKFEKIYSLSDEKMSVEDAIANACSLLKQKAKSILDEYLN